MLFENMLLGARRIRGLIEEHFTSSTSWTAPAGVSEIVALELRGGTGTSSSYSWRSAPMPLGRIFAGFPYSISRSTLESYANSQYNRLPSTPGVSVNFSSGSPLIGRNYTQYADGPSDYSTSQYTGTFRVRHNQVKTKVGSPEWGNGWGTSGTWTPGSQMLAWGVGNIEERVTTAGSSGGSTSAFGYTASGGSSGGGTGQVIQQAAVSVTPGQSYNLSIPSGGYVSFAHLL